MLMDVKHHKKRWTIIRKTCQLFLRHIIYHGCGGYDMKHLIKEVIDYMEAHLLDNISQKDIARHVGVSVFHLHRFFKTYTEISMTEYLRNRRLSLAGMDVLDSELTILEIALKYQYDTQEGFQKAFYRFHGINPLKARVNHEMLKTYHPLKIVVTFKGGMSMDYRIEHVKPFKLTCVKRKFKNSIIDDEFNHDISDFWDEMITDGTVKDLHRMSSDEMIYGPCGKISEDSDYFEYGIGVVAKDDAESKYETWNINHEMYAVFVVNTKNDIGAVWKHILEVFLPNSHYEMADEADFEKYPSHDRYFCEIWVPIVKQ